jgi:hypothetical protein
MEEDDAKDPQQILKRPRTGNVCDNPPKKHKRYVSLSEILKRLRFVLLASISTVCSGPTSGQRHDDRPVPDKLFRDLFSNLLNAAIETAETACTPHDLEICRSGSMQKLLTHISLIKGKKHNKNVLRIDYERLHRDFKHCGESERAVDELNEILRAFRESQRTGDAEDNSAVQDSESASKPASKPARRRLKKGILRKTADGLRLALMNSISTVRIEPTSGQPRDRHVPDKLCGDLFTNLFNAAIKPLTLSCTQHELENSRSAWMQMLLEYLSIKGKEYKKKVSRIDYDCLHDAFKNFGDAVDELQTILRVFREAQRTGDRERRFSSEPIAFPSLCDTTGGERGENDGQSLGWDDEEMPAPGKAAVEVDQQRSRDPFSFSLLIH